MNIIFLGPPGSGKGTIAERLVHDYNFVHISTGAILRAAIAEQSILGMQVQELVESGALIPDKLMSAVLQNYIQNNNFQTAIIFDGFPRTVVQAQKLDTFARPDMVIVLSVADDVLVKRLSGRRVHSNSGRIYHIVDNPPQEDNKDDITGEPLTIRPDDQESVINKRLALYHEQTSPVITYYHDNSHTRVEMIAADNTIDMVYQKVCAALQ